MGNSESTQTKTSGRLVLFDFDGTITTKDTFIEFIKFACGATRFYLGFVFLSPVLILYKLRLIKNWRAKEIVFAYFFKGMPFTTFQEWGKRFATEKLPALLKKQALEKLQEHKRAGDTIYIVTASSSIWIDQWSKPLMIPVIDTRWEINGDGITGKIEGKNCYGLEKALRIQNTIPVEHFHTIIAYGDTRGDREMLALAHQKNYRTFDR